MHQDLTSLSKIKNPGKLLARVLAEVFRHYALHYIVVLCCILVSALVNVQVSVFLRTLMDDYIAPMLKQANPDFQPLFNALCKMVCLYLIGVFCGWLNSFTMAFVTQGTYRKLTNSVNVYAITFGTDDYKLFIEHLNAMIRVEKAVLKSRTTRSEAKKEGSDTSNPLEDGESNAPETPQEGETNTSQTPASGEGDSKDDTE